MCGIAQLFTKTISFFLSFALRIRMYANNDVVEVAAMIWFVLRMKLYSCKRSIWGFSDTNCVHKNIRFIQARITKTIIDDCATFLKISRRKITCSSVVCGLRSFSNLLFFFSLFHFKVKRVANILQLVTDAFEKAFEGREKIESLC